MTTALTDDTGKNMIDVGENMINIGHEMIAALNDVTDELAKCLARVDGRGGREGGEGWEGGEGGEGGEGETYHSLGKELASRSLTKSALSSGEGGEGETQSSFGSSDNEYTKAKATQSLSRRPQSALSSGEGGESGGGESGELAKTPTTPPAAPQSSVPPTSININVNLLLKIKNNVIIACRITSTMPAVLNVARANELWIPYATTFNLENGAYAIAGLNTIAAGAPFLVGDGDGDAAKYTDADITIESAFVYHITQALKTMTVSGKIKPIYLHYTLKSTKIKNAAEAEAEVVKLFDAAETANKNLNTADENNVSSHDVVGADYKSLNEDVVNTQSLNDTAMRLYKTAKINAIKVGKELWKCFYDKPIIQSTIFKTLLKLYIEFAPDILISKDEQNKLSYCYSLSFADELKYDDTNTQIALSDNSKLPITKNTIYVFMSVIKDFSFNQKGGRKSRRTKKGGKRYRIKSRKFRRF